MTIDKYYKRKWQYPEMAYRAVNPKGKETYFDSMPTKRFVEWRNIGFPNGCKAGKHIRPFFAKKFWANSLQSFEDYMILRAK